MAKPYGFSVCSGLRAQMRLLSARDINKQNAGAKRQTGRNNQDKKIGRDIAIFFVQMGQLFRYQINVFYGVISARIKPVPEGAEADQTRVTEPGEFFIYVLKIKLWVGVGDFEKPKKTAKVDANQPLQHIPVHTNLLNCCYLFRQALKKGYASRNPLFSFVYAR
ncbi:hypothetical protein [Buttiauxella agrestis]|uniref:hypothetical protein n=1 Tax=Buttiauxella agrestis TaxID=82977 RepID=UPI0012E0AA9A|nr:hypothetical protein [Buttiauxella agrestis]